MGVVLWHGAASAREIALAATEYPPYYGESMVQGGPVVELTLQVLRDAGYTPSVRFMPWVRALQWGEGGQVDGLIGVWHSSDREASFLYSHPLVDNRIVLCRLGDHGPARFSGFDALRPYTVGVVSGYADPPELAQAGVHTEAVVEDLQNLRKLVAGRIDLALIDSRVAKHLIEHDLDARGQAINCLEPAVQRHPQYLVISRRVPDAPRIIAAFNEKLRVWRRTKEYRELAQRWGW
jgi:polar amino acid transport system substrate-binding protein